MQPAEGGSDAAGGELDRAEVGMAVAVEAGGRVEVDAGFAGGGVVDDRVRLADGAAPAGEMVTGVEVTAVGVVGRRRIVRRGWLTGAVGAGPGVGVGVGVGAGADPTERTRSCPVKPTPETPS